MESTYTDNKGRVYNIAQDENVDEDTFKLVFELSDPKANQPALGEANFPAVATFEKMGLPDSLLQGIYTMGFRAPSKIQSNAMPLLLANPPRNMIAQSQSGTGKTAAFVITMLARVDISLQYPQALCLAPTRELARQIMLVVQTLGRHMGVGTQFVIPGHVERSRKITAHIVVGTPGTAMDCINRGRLPVDMLKVLVIDEADNMLDQQGLGEQCIRVKNHIRHRPQILLWSATFPQNVMDYTKMFAPDAYTLTLKHHELTVAGIKQMYMDCNNAEQKFDILVKLYHVLTIGSSIIFVHKRSDATKIANRMASEGHKVSLLHAQLEGGAADRDKVIDDFRTGTAKVLITTNVLARGIDVATVSMVVNYDLPMDRSYQVDAQTYLHRIGRTGRFGRVGVSISFVHDQNSWKQLSSVAKYFGVPIARVPTDDIDEVERVVQKILKGAPPVPGAPMEESRHVVKGAH